MAVITIDFETTYSKDYSLSKMSEAEYILDDRFEAIMCAVKLGDGPSRVFIGHDEIAARFEQIDWERTAVLAHNTRFDGSILAWHFGIVPRLYLDTLSMCRADTHWVIGKSSLKAVSEHLGLPPKGDEVVKAMGKRLSDFTDDELNRYAEYCKRDNDNCHEIWKQLRYKFPPSELRLIDLVLRMFILPQVQLNGAVIKEHLEEVRGAKAMALEEVAHIPKEAFSSNQKFAELLSHYGVVVPMKLSPRTGQMIPALARGDWDFKELCADDSQPTVVQTILATRRSVKSTIDETRAEGFLRLSRLKWPAQGRYWAPIPLKFSGARTHRLSGDGGMNWQNIRRGSALRAAVMAPTGYRIVHRDASQIEARMTAWMAWCMPLLGAFGEGRDVYSEFASSIYDRPVDRHDVLERFVGKTAILGLGYGCGPAKFRHMLFIGNGGVSLRVELAEAEKIVLAYRQTYPEIPDLWAACNSMLLHMFNGTPQRRDTLIKHLPITLGEDHIVLPNGLTMKYPNLGFTFTEEGREVCYDDPYGGRRKIYGAKAVENLSQALSRIVITDIALAIHSTTGRHPFLSTHDSLDYCVPASEALDLDTELTRQFALRPKWAPDLPLASEGGWGKTLDGAEMGYNE